MSGLIDTSSTGRPVLPRAAVYLHRPRNSFSRATLKTFVAVAQARNIVPIVLAMPAGPTTASDCALDTPSISVERFNDGTLHTVLAPLTGQYAITGIYTDYEQDVLAAAKLRRHFALPGLQPEVARRFRDKNLMHAAAAQVARPAFRLPDSLPEIPNYNALHRFARTHRFHIVVKLRNGSGASQVHVAKTDVDIRRIYAEVIAPNPTAYRAEAFIRSDVRQVHVDSIVCHGQVHFANPSQYTYDLVDYREASFPGTISCRYQHHPIIARILQANAQILAQLGLHHGVAHAEFYISAGQVFFGEVGAREGGGPIRPMLQALTGIDITECAILMQIDPDYTPPPPAPSQTTFEIGAFLLTSPERGRVEEITAPLVAGAIIAVHLDTQCGDTATDPKTSSQCHGYCLVRGRDRYHILSDYLQNRRFALRTSPPGDAPAST